MSCGTTTSLPLTSLPPSLPCRLLPYDCLSKAIVWDRTEVQHHCQHSEGEVVPAQAGTLGQLHVRALCLVQGEEPHRASVRCRAESVGTSGVHLGQSPRGAKSDSLGGSAYANAPPRPPCTLNSLLGFRLYSSCCCSVLFTISKAFMGFT